MQELISSSQALCTISLEFDSPIATLDFGGAPPSSCGHMSHGERGVKTVRPRGPPHPGLRGGGTRGSGPRSLGPPCPFLRHSDSEVQRQKLKMDSSVLY